MNDNMIENFMKKTSTKITIGCGSILFIFIMIIAVFYVVVKNMNTIQGIFDNIGNNYNDVEKVLNAFSLSAAGTEGEQLYAFLNELASKYNELDEETERDSDFDLPLIMATLHYEKLFDSEIYKEGILNGVKLTNREVSNFLNETIETEMDYKMFYKWAYLMVGTPYSIPDINLRGLTGSLISAKVVSKCVEGGSNKSLTKLLESIAKKEVKFTEGKVDDSGGLFGWLKNFFGNDKDHTHNVYYDHVLEKVKKAYNARGTDDPITAFINFDQYNPDMQCGGGTSLEHQYIRTMHYEQYKEYLRTVFIPQNFLDCEECLYKDADDDLRARVTSSMIRDIFDSAKTFYMYADLEPIEYETLEFEGEPIPSSMLPHMTSAVASSSCAVTSPYSDLRGSYPHHAVDSIISGGKVSDIIGKDTLGNKLTRDSLVAVMDGVVKEVTVLTTEKLPYDEKAGTCTENMALNGGVYVIIEHEHLGMKYQSKYYHLKANSVVVKEGDSVIKGQKIAEIGTTGCSTGEHLHFEFINASKNQILNPTVLFSKCSGLKSEEVMKLPTTDDYYASGMIEVVADEPGEPEGLFPIEVYVTGVVKAEIMGIDDFSLVGEAYKAQAIAARTYAMKITDWGKGTIENSSNNQNMAWVDIEGKDKALYELVLETQGMVLTHSSEIFMSEYANWPCQIVEKKYLSVSDIENEYALERASYVLSFADELEHVGKILKPSDFPKKSEDRFWYTDANGKRIFNHALYEAETVGPINKQLAEVYEEMYGGSCSWYHASEEGNIIKDPLFFAMEHGQSFGNIGVILKYLPKTEEHYFEVGIDYIYEQFYGHNRGMTQIGAVFMSEMGDDYVTILDEFYESKAGKTEILTAPGLVRVFADDSYSSSFNNQVEFSYGETLPGANNWHICKESSSKDDFYEAELKKYVENAGLLAQADGVNPLRAQVVGAAYWLAFNPYFKVQYDLGGKYPEEGINNKWGCKTSAPSDMKTPAETTLGLDCNSFVRWAFAQIGKEISLGTNDGPRRIQKCSTSGLTVGQIAKVAQLGDVLIKNKECHGTKYGHVALVFGVNADEGTFSVIHANGYTKNITITEYKSSSKVTDYNWVLSMTDPYDEE